MVYKFKPMSMIKTDAQTAGEFCEELSKTVGLTAKNLLDASRAEDAPLHNEFEWDNDVAAEAYRIDQARYIIRQLVVIPDEEEQEEQQPVTRAFFTVEREKYEPVGIILKDEEKSSILFSKALAELYSFERKYSALTQLGPIFAAIAELKRKEMGGA